MKSTRCGTPLVPALSHFGTGSLEACFLSADMIVPLRICEQIVTPAQWQESVRSALQAHADGRPQDAIVGWHEIIGLDPDWYFPHYELAHGYQAICEYARAIEHAEKAIELHPPFHSLWHEIPMRVVIMSSHRRRGNHGKATAIMKDLGERGLVNVVPELLIEKARAAQQRKGSLGGRKLLPRQSPRSTNKRIRSMIC
jgi:tetratricopeptide (TPR) repeat protein